jgi:chaperonin cofactor prefoldin
MKTNKAEIMQHLADKLEIIMLKMTAFNSMYQYSQQEFSNLKIIIILCSKTKLLKI